MGNCSCRSSGNTSSMRSVHGDDDDDDESSLYSVLSIVHYSCMLTDVPACAEDLVRAYYWACMTSFQR